jgi:branched-chain amino acid transport system permease protein
MLVATFAVSFLLQNAALLVFGSQGENIGFLTDLNQALEIGSLRIRWITLVGLGVGGVLLTLMGVVLGRTDIGLQMRAAAADFGTARLLGVRAQRVIRVAFVLGGILAAAVGLVLAVQRPLVTPGYGFAVLVPALVGVVVGGLDRLVPATLGGFAVGFATVLLGNVLPPGGRVFLDTALFTLVIIVLLAKPNGLFAGSRQVGERI